MRFLARRAEHDGIVTIFVKHRGNLYPVAVMFRQAGDLEVANLLAWGANALLVVLGLMQAQRRARRNQG